MEQKNHKLCCVKVSRGTDGAKKINKYYKLRLDVCVKIKGSAISVLIIVNFRNLLRKNHSK